MIAFCPRLNYYLINPLLLPGCGLHMDTHTLQCQLHMGQTDKPVHIYKQRSQFPFRALDKGREEDKMAVALDVKCMVEYACVLCVHGTVLL